MITLEKLKIYKKYSGNIESWDRFGKKEDKRFLEYEEWELIDELIQNLEMIEKELVSESFRLQTLNKLIEFCDSKKTQQVLISISQTEDNEYS